MYCEKKSNLVSVIDSTECIPCIPKFQETHRGCVPLMFLVDECIIRCKEDMQVYKLMVRCVACVASIEVV